MVAGPENRKATPTIPPHISKKMRAWIHELLAEWEFSADNFKVLILAAEAHDRYNKARIVLSKKGVSYTDRFGAPRCRPEVAVERDSRLAFLRCIRALNLEYDEPEEEPLAKRPYTTPMIGGGRR
jgi:hypothetical protein